MCDFKAGDEVVCVDDSRPEDNWPGPYPVVGRVYRVEGFDESGPDDEGSVGLIIEGLGFGWDPGWGTVGWRHTRFRKVQRRNSRLTLEALFTVPGGFEEPKRAPAKTPERV